MSAFRIFLKVIFLLLLTLESVKADGIAGFDNLNWKMTKSQVGKIYPNFEEWVEERPSSYNPVTGKMTDKTQEDLFGLKEYYLLGCKTKMNVDFINNELESISFTIFEVKGSGCQDRLKEALTGKYGVPTRTLPNENTETSESLGWKYKDTDINMTTIYYTSEAKIFLHYSNSGVFVKWLLEQTNKDKL